VTIVRKLLHRSRASASLSVPGRPKRKSVFTSMPGNGLLKAVQHGTAPLLGAGKKVRGCLAAVLFSQRHVECIAMDGTIR
jgi:hypothetical protein